MGGSHGSGKVALCEDVPAAGTAARAGYIERRGCWHHLKLLESRYLLYTKDKIVPDEVGQS
jgi:hypothetical protein